MTRGQGRSGRPYRRVRAELKAKQLPCHICGKPIDYTLPGTEPMSFAMDHVVPLAFGGHPLAMSNVRASHRRCNAAKGTKATADVVIIPQSRAW
jgi:5-methylcytosine-specific restriction endonuclease McrA